MFIFLLAVNAYSQDYHFTSFNYNETFYNPAYAASNTGLKTSITNSIVPLSNGETSHLNAFAIDFYDLHFMNGGFGLNTVNEKGNGFSTESVELIYNKYFCIPTNIAIHNAFSVKYVHLSNYVKTSDYQNNSLYNSSDFSTDNIEGSHISLSYGMLIRYLVKTSPVKSLMTITGGGSLQQFNNPKTVSVKHLNYLPSRKVAHLKFSISPFHRKDFFIIPFYMYQYQGSPNRISPEGIYATERRAMASLDFLGYFPNYSKYAFNIGGLVEKTNWNYSIYNEAGSKQTWMYALNFGIKNTIAKRKAEKWYHNYQKSVELNYSFAIKKEFGEEIHAFHSLTISSDLKDLYIPLKPNVWYYIKCPLDRYYKYEQIGR